MEVEEFVCADGLQAPREDDAILYHCYRDRRDHNRLWMVAANRKNLADHIYVGYPYDTKSEGFAGRWLVFNLVDHEKAVTLQGPWHSNADALYEFTNVDVRDKHYVQFVAGKTFKNVGSRRILTDILYYEDPDIRGYNDHKAVLRRLFEESRCDIRYWHGGSGGSTSGTYGKRDYDRETCIS